MDTSANECRYITTPLFFIALKMSTSLWKNTLQTMVLVGFFDCVLAGQQVRNNTTYKSFKTENIKEEKC